jgi:hypothetical protein
MRCRVVWCGAAACEMKTAADTEQRSDSAAGVGAWAALVCAAGACSNARAHQRAQSPAPAAAPLTSHSCSVLVKAAVAGCASCRKPMPRPTSCKARGGGGGCRDGAVWAAFRGSTCSTHVTLPPQLERAWELCSAAASARSARHTHQQHGCVGDARPLEAQAHDDAAAEGHEDEQGAVGGRHLARVLA